jgi:hypothetical protein
LRDIRQKPQGTIKTRLAAAIGAGQDIKSGEPDSDVAQRTITGDGKSRHHHALAWRSTVSATEFVSLSLYPTSYD